MIEGEPYGGEVGPENCLPPRQASRHQNLNQRSPPVTTQAAVPNEFWRRWLIVAAGITGLAGLGLATLSVVGATGVYGTIFDLSFLPGDPPAPTGDVASFASGVTGAVMVGWAATMLVVARAGLAPSNWRALTVGLSAWFVVDGVVSVAAGAVGNLILNGVLLTLFVPALIATRPDRGPVLSIEVAGGSAQ
jgi:hypothetical protein